MIKYPDYTKSLVNLSSSICKYYGVSYKHNTLESLDKYLNKKYKNVILLLCDGMGSFILDKHKEVSTYLLENKKDDISSVFPPTTTAATTSVLSALTPYEHGWLGWDVYLKPLDQTVTLYTNKLKDSDIDAKEVKAANKYLGYESIVKRISNKVDAYSLYPFGEKAYGSVNELFDRLTSLCNNDSDKFIYAYYDNPDAYMHVHGTTADIVNKNIKLINDSLEKFIKKVSDTLVIVIADHGHIDSSCYTLIDYPKIYNMLERTTSIEPRACSFKIKDNMHQEFELEFNKEFGDDFILLSKDKVNEINLFGIGDMNPYYSDAIGDYVALAKGLKNIKYDYNSPRFKSSHAGLTEDEMVVPLIVIEKD